MIKTIEQLAIREGKTIMKLDVSGFAKALQASYRRQGYSDEYINKSGVRIPVTIKFEDDIHWELKPEYQEDVNKDFIVMSKNLT